MNIIKEHIKRNEYKSVYLIYGTEVYLKKLYRDKLKNGIISIDDTINYSYFEGKSADPSEIKSIAETLPFFSERRLIIIENCGWFKTQGTFDEYLSNMPESTYIVFVETDIDKRGKLYKKVKELGYISEMNGMDENNLRLFSKSLFKGKMVQDNVINFFIEAVGSDMSNMVNEAEKLICYTMEKDYISPEDVRAVCTEQLSNRIFIMIDAIAARDRGRALNLYNELIILREKPLSVLFLLIRHFNILLQIKEISAYERDSKVIAGKVAVPPFAVNKYINQVRSFNARYLRDLIAFGIETEEQIKTGRLDEKIGVEFMILRCSQNIA